MAWSRTTGEKWPGAVPAVTASEDRTLNMTSPPTRRPPAALFDLRRNRLYRLDKKSLLVGSKPSNDVVLSDPLVSRRHCRIEQRQDGWWVVDAGSRNGTYLNGIRVQAARIHVGDALELGGTILHCTSARQVETPPGRRVQCHELISADPVMHQVFRNIERLADTDLTVLVSGESGTGKELAARALHALSSRSEQPFLPLNCGGLPASLLEAELFGADKGAYTGAERSRPGMFEAAHKGTLFLDEIGELPLAQQAVLLRVLDTGMVRRVGSTKLRRVDVRVVAATNRNLADMVAEGTFRQDLYYRLAEASLHMPPLRQRPRDVGLLVHHFLAEQPGGRRVGSPPYDVLARLQSHRWPGNVRELKNFVRRAAALGWQEAAATLAEGTKRPPGQASGDRVADRTSLSYEAQVEHTPEEEPSLEALEKLERRWLAMALRLAGGSLVRAAQLVHLGRNTFRAKAARHGLL